MIYDKEIKKLVGDINDACSDYIGYVTDLNECAFTDRKIEFIIDKCKTLEEYHNKRYPKKYDLESNKLSTGQLEYEILNYWNDSDDLYVNYIVVDKEKDLRANAIAYFNTSDIGCNYNDSTDEKIKENLLKLLRESKGHEFELPKVSELSSLLKYIYDFVCESEANMCHIDEDNWKDLIEEENYSNEDLKKLKEEIEKYNLKDYITIDSDGYKICGYGCLQCCFNDDTVDRADELER